MSLKAVGGIWGALFLGVVGYMIWSGMNKEPQPKPLVQGG